MEQEFELKTLKLGELGIDCKYQLSETDDDGVVTENDFHVKVTRPIHTDLRDLFEKDLAGIVAEVLDNTQYLAEVEMGNTHIIPTGVAFAGKDENVGVAISGYIETKFGRVGFKTPRIKYLASESEVAAKLTVFADKVVAETHAYLFDNKTAEMGVFGE